jgi:hypothetical protein
MRLRAEECPGDFITADSTAPVDGLITAIGGFGDHNAEAVAAFWTVPG